MNSLRRKSIRKNSNTGGMGINRRRCRDASIACTSGNALHSCVTIGTETAQSNKDGSQQVDNEKSAQRLNSDRGSNNLASGLKQTNLLKPHDDISSEPPFKGFFMKAKEVVSGSKESLNRRIEEGNSDCEKSGDKSKCMDEGIILASALDNSNESEPSNTNKCSVTREVNWKAGNKPSDEILASHHLEDRQGELMIASPQNSSSGDTFVTHRYSNKQHDSLKAKESLNPGSAPESNRTGRSDLRSNMTKLSFSVGKVAVNQVSGLKGGSGAILSSKHTDHDKQTNQNAPVICKNMEDKSVKDHRTVASARQNMNCARNKDKPDTHGDNNGNVVGDLTLGEKKQVRFQLDHEANNGLQERSLVAANGRQPSTPQNDTFDKAISELSNMVVLPKENNCLSSMHNKNDNLKESHSGPPNLMDQDNSRSSLEISSEAVALEASATEVEISDNVEKFSKDNARKRRRLILDDDEVEEEKVEDVQKENVNPEPMNCDEPMMKNRGDTEYFVEEAVQTGELNDKKLINARAVKRRRRYIAENDEEDIVGSANVECALSDATNRSLNDGAKMVPQTLVATDHSQQSRPSHSEYDNQQYDIYSQPLDDPVWSGLFTIDTDMLMLDAHLSTKACQRVKEQSTFLQSVVEVKKLPRSQAWPKSWKSFGPTDNNIGLFFFPHDFRQNEVYNRLVNNIIKSDGALKATVGMAELLIFPSSLLPEEYHSLVFQGNHYLWGVFRRRKDVADATVVVKEQDGSVKHAAEQGKQQHDLLSQQDGALYESSNQETFAAKHVVHIENQLLVECDREARKEAAKAATREGTTSPGSSWSSAKMNSPKVGSDCSVKPRNDSKLDAHGDLDQQEDCTSLPEWNASSITEQSSESGPAAVDTKLIKLVEHSHGQPHSGSESSTRKLFGFVAARTPKSQQLIQEMVNEGALLFPVPDEIVTTSSITGSSTRAVSSEMNPDTAQLHRSEPPQAFDFVSMGDGEPGADSEACLELFPVRQEHIGWAPSAEVSREVNLDLSLGKRSRAPSLPPLL
ncbi:unnamed protein product [Urochloa decumbens]|uniref:AIPP2-like SPOC-like domain-containing protein n=1 Tax=Urochloa decumbens TaxID=240449 RepID=A0ABC9GQJ6_9POAL